MVCERHKNLNDQLLNTTKELERLSEITETLTGETNGFTSRQEIEEVIRVLNSRLNRHDFRSKENEKIMLQIQDLKDLLPKVKKIEEITENLEVLQKEKDLINEYLVETVKEYEDLISKCN